MLPEIVSRRVRLRPLRESDLAAFSAIVAANETMRFLRDGIGLAAEEARSLFEDLLDEAEDEGYGSWAIEDVRDDELLGYVSLLPYDDGVAELEFLIAHERWGRGFATEAVRMAVRHAFEALRCTRVVGAVHPGNRAGQRVLEKAGMAHREDTTDPHGLRMYLYALTALERRMMRSQ